MMRAIGFTRLGVNWKDLSRCTRCRHCESSELWPVARWRHRCNHIQRRWATNRKALRKIHRKVRTYSGYQSSSDNSRQSAIQGIIHAVGHRNPSLKLWKEGIKVSRPIKGKPTRDWTKAFNCPKCEDGRLRMKIKEDALVCEKCGYRREAEPKTNWVVDG